MSKKANGQNTGPTHPKPPLRWRHHHQFPPCHAAVATLAVTSARVLGSRNAAVLLKARLTGREFSACCTALAFRVALKCLAASAEAPSAAVVPIAARAPRVALKRGALWIAYDRLPNDRLPWKLGRANERASCGAKCGLAANARAPLKCPPPPRKPPM